MPNTDMRLTSRDGILYAYDISRNKLLSVPKLYLRAGTHRRTVSNEYLRVEDGQPTMSVGDMLLRDATITALSINCETASSWTLKIFKKGSHTPLVTLAMVSNTIASNQTLNADVSAGSVIQFKVEGVHIPFPRAMLELAWRI